VRARLGERRKLKPRVGSRELTICFIKERKRLKKNSPLLHSARRQEGVRPSRPTNRGEGESELDRLFASTVKEICSRERKSKPYFQRRGGGDRNGYLQNFSKKKREGKGSALASSRFHEASSLLQEKRRKAHQEQRGKKTSSTTPRGKEKERGKGGPSQGIQSPRGKRRKSGKVKRFLSKKSFSPSWK